MGADRFDGLMEGGLEALSRLRTSLEIPCQDVLVFSFRLGMKRDLSHSTVLPSVLGLADGRHAKDQAVPCQPRPRPSDVGSRSTRQNRTAVHSSVLVRPVVLRPTPSGLLRARLVRLEGLARSRGPLACCPPKAVSILVQKILQGGAAGVEPARWRRVSKRVSQSGFQMHCMRRGSHPPPTPPSLTA